MRTMIGVQNRGAEENVIVVILSKKENVSMIKRFGNESKTFGPAPTEKKQQNEAIRYDSEKPRMDLIPPEVLVALGKVLGFGAEKYEHRNWEKGLNWGRITGALLRHITAWMGGEDCDKESGLHHLHHAACNIAFLITHIERNLGVDDRFVMEEKNITLGGDNEHSDREI